MEKVKVYNLEGKEVEELKLDPAVFNIEINPNLVHQVVEIQKANSRIKIAAAKGRSDVRGGGRKPWRQKGTGRARHGSIRSPLWIGGGVTFGPAKDRDYSKKINKKMKRKALFMGLTDKVSDKRLIVVDKLELSKIKTKDLFAIFKKLTKETKSILVVLASKDDTITRSAKNLPKVKTILADSLNIVDLLQYNYLIIDKAGIKKLIATYKK